MIFAPERGISAPKWHNSLLDLSLFYMALLKVISTQRQPDYSEYPKNVPSWLTVPQQVAGYPIYMPQQPVFAAPGSADYVQTWADYRWSNFYLQTLVKEPVNDSLYENYQDYLSGTWTELPPIITTAPPALITRSSLLNATAASINAALLAPLLAPPATTAFSTTQPADSTSNATMSKGADAGANLLQTVAAKSSVSSDEGTTTSTATEEVPDDEEVPDTGDMDISALISNSSIDDDLTMTPSPGSEEGDNTVEPEASAGGKGKSQARTLAEATTAPVSAPASALMAEASAPSPFILPPPSLLTSSGLTNSSPSLITPSPDAVAKISHGSFVNDTGGMTNGQPAPSINQSILRNVSLFNTTLLSMNTNATRDNTSQSEVEHERTARDFAAMAIVRSRQKELQHRASLSRTSGLEGALPPLVSHLSLGNPAASNSFPAKKSAHLGREMTKRSGLDMATVRPMKMVSRTEPDGDPRKFQGKGNNSESPKKRSICAPLEKKGKLGICVEPALVGEICDGMTIKKAKFCRGTTVCCVPAK